MAPAAYAKDERVLCFHHELLYEAKILENRPVDASDKKSPLEFRVHYKGWKNTWDDWVSHDRLRKLTEENKELAAALKKELDAQRQQMAATSKKGAGAKKKSAAAARAASDISSVRGSEEPHSAGHSAAGPRGQKRGRESDAEKEESFVARPSVRMVVPDHVKSILVDDWENVTKNLHLVSLPCEHTVNKILDAYHEHEKENRRPGSPDADLLDEFVQGLREYFELALGKILLYRLERDQFFQVREWWENPTAEHEGVKGPADVYGAEHLARLFVNMPELISETNMDPQSVRRLREEVVHVTQWLAKRSDTYFVADYEHATQDYLKAIRGD